ncbi:uncharacterized protein PG986_004216 [Apiospora aurea]|uniref:Rhodopsin domain-containing protein n=1 Tax=Apiospora aurea TaxID=335848 RepID=A0ABR1QLY8_9PEZI
MIVLDNPVGPHQWDVPVLTAASVVLYALGCMAVKSTLLVFYLRIFAPQPNAKRLIWSGLVSIVVFYLISVIVTLASCLPRAGDGGWSILSPSRGDRCFEEDSRFAEVQGIVGALTDLYVWIVPMTVIVKVRLSRKQKIGVYGVFATGFLFLSTHYRESWLLAHLHLGSSTDHEDSVAELNIGIICACMLVVFVLFRGIVRRLLEWIKQPRASGKPQNKNEWKVYLNAEVEGGNGNLPSVPPGALSGLKRFMQRTLRSRATDTNLTLADTARGDVSSFVSADYNYHAHLDRPWMSRDVAEDAS